MSIASNISIVGCLVLALGCSWSPKKTPVSGLPSHSKEPLPERYYVMEAALRYVLDKHSRHGVEREYYSAYVIERGEFSSDLVAAFLDYTPRVTDSIRVSTRTGEALNRATRKRVKVWSVRIRELQADRAAVEVTWYSASHAAGGHRVTLRCEDGRWTVESEKMEWVS